MRTLLAILALGCLISGCASPRPASYGVTQDQLKAFADKAVAYEQSPQRRTRGQQPLRDYDSSKPIRFWMESGKRPKIWVYVPLRETAGTGYSYGSWRFDMQSGEVEVIGLIQRVEP